MDIVIDFSSKTSFTQPVVEKFLIEEFCCNSIYWVSNFFEYCIENEIDAEKTYISHIISNEGFKYHYTVWSNKYTRRTLRQRIELLKQLAKKEQIEILSSDDEIAPFSMVLIEPNGKASTVMLKTVDDLIIEDSYNFPLGDFRTENPITDQEREIIIKIIKPVYSEISIEHGTDGPIINGDFNKVKPHFEKLKGFDQHYEIRPAGKNEWLDRTEKSGLFIAFMKDFQKQLQKDLCIFPRNYRDINDNVNAEHCILLTNGGEEKIVYTD